MTWHPIETAPWKRPVLLKGESGYPHTDGIVIVMAYRVEDYRHGAWLDMAGERQSEGWPDVWTHWMEIP